MFTDEKAMKAARAAFVGYMLIRYWYLTVPLGVGVVLLNVVPVSYRDAVMIGVFAALIVIGCLRGYWRFALSIAAIVFALWLALTIRDTSGASISYIASGLIVAIGWLWGFRKSSTVISGTLLGLTILAYSTP